MIVSYDAYRVFYTVARLGSFTKAAGALLSSSYYGVDGCVDLLCESLQKKGNSHE